jgi:hypothetical protein
MKARFRLNNVKKIINKRNQLCLILDFELIELDSWNLPDLAEELKKYFKCKDEISSIGKIYKDSKNMEGINMKFKDGNFHVEITICSPDIEDVELDYWEVEF